jgi:hypothetical protein
MMVLSLGGPERQRALRKAGEGLILTSSQGCSNGSASTLEYIGRKAMATDSKG